jgi:hypothetical protein
VLAKGSSAYAKATEIFFFLIIVSGHIFGVKSISYTLGSEISVSGTFMTFTRLLLYYLVVNILEGTISGKKAVGSP